MKKIFLLLFLTLLCLSSSLFADDGDAGYAGSFLQVPIGARPTAMGSAYISLSNDASGAFYNVAGMSSLRRSVIATSYRSMGLDRSLGYVSFVLPAQGNAVIGLSWLNAGSGSVVARNTDGDPLGFDLSQSDNQIAIIFSKRFERYLSFGFKGSYLHSQFAEMTAFSVGIDLGVTLYLSQLFSRETRDLMAIQDIRAGLIVRNLEAVYKWNNDDYLEAHGSSTAGGSDHIDKVPVEIGIGASARFLNRKLLLASDLVKNIEQSFVAHLGAEYYLNEKFALRTGYTDNSMTAGFGYLFKLDNLGLAFDYAFSTDKVDEGSEHIFSFDLLF